MEKDETMGMAKLENGYIVIKIDVLAIPDAALHAWDKFYGRHNIRVEDIDIFAKEMISALNAENEIGDTLVHRMLDRAAYNAAEHGAEGLSA